MIKKFLKDESLRDMLIMGFPVLAIALALLIVGIIFVQPAPPNHLTLATGDDQGDLESYAKQYQRLLKDDGVRVDILKTRGPLENLRLLQDGNSGVMAAFVQDGLGSTDLEPDVSSLGSLYYEPVWIFYRGNLNITHFSQLEGKRIGVGRVGHANQVIAQRLLVLNGVDPKDATLINMSSDDALKALENGTLDAALFMRPASDPMIHELASRKGLRLMDVEQAEAIARKDAAFHHLILPRGAIDLNADIPSKDVDLVASTTTMLVSDELHPALAYLLLKAAAQIHDEPGIFERRGEFPANKDSIFLLSSDAVQFYKSGGPFWQRYLPYWLAAWLDRFVLLVIPVLAVAFPLLKTVPQAYHWRMRTRVYQRYGELKFLETQVRPGLTKEQVQDLVKKLDRIEERVDSMRMPRNFADFVYSLKGHIQLVRDRLTKAGSA